MTLASTRWTLFDQPQLLEGEDAAAYHELLARLRAAVKPIDIIEDMLIADIAFLEWEVLRLRRLKTTLIRERARYALENLLPGKLDYDLYSDRFEELLTEILQEKLPEAQADDVAQSLAHECARNDPEAGEKVEEDIGLSLDNIRKSARTDKAKDLVQRYVRHEPDAVALVDKLLAEAGTSMDALVVDAFVENLDNIERIDRLTTLAEGRRNSSLREIDRRRMVLGETLRRAVQEVEEADFEVIDTTPPKGEKAA